MALFVINCTDKPASLELRTATRPEHLAYLAGLGDRLTAAGPYVDEAGVPQGSMIIAEFPDLAAARAFADADPYNKAGLFQAVAVKQWRKALPA